MRFLLKYSLFAVLFLKTCSMLSQELPPNPNTDYNWISSISYNIEGVTLSKGVNYFNDLGKSTQSLSWDINNNLVWGSQTLYDYHGRSALQTLSAPLTSGSYFEFDYQLILDNTGSYNYEDFDQGYFIENPKMVSTNSKLGSYYFNNSSNAYQDNTNYPFSRTVYSKLNPGASIGVLGGNKINGQWKQSYSFAMPAGTELSTSQAFGNNKIIYDDMRILKTVSRDIHGVEVVIFTDGDGNVLAAARSGNEEQASTPIINTLTIKEQGYVDIHIPVGCTGITVTNPRNIDLKIFDLITEEVEVEVVTTTFVLDPGFYRVAVRDPETYIYNESNPIVIKHTVNYYDYALNYYDYAGRLLRSEQPKSGVSTFVYNSLGQLQSTSNTDEGDAQFIYRKDGQIRFSQNEKQQENTEFSYTNYDKLGRPIESGVYKFDDILFSLTPFETVDNTPIPASPVVISTTNLDDVTLNTNPQGKSYLKNENSVDWNAGFNSQEVLQENGYFTFKYGYATNGPNPMFGDYNVMVGLSPADAITDSNFETIKFAFNLRQESGDTSLQIRIYENGDFITDNNGQIRTFGTFNESSKFKIKRQDGTISYYLGASLLYTSIDTYLEPLIVDTSFKYTGNAINNLYLLIEEVAPPTPDNGTDIHALIDVVDGLDDSNCIEQTFTLFDLPDKVLPNLLNACGIPNRYYKQTFLSGNVSKTYTKNPRTNTTWYSYDVYGRVKWIIQKVEGLECVKTIEYNYDPISGQITKVDYQRHEKSERFIHKYEYNVGGQLTFVRTSLDDLTFKEQAAYTYNQAGQLTRTVLAENLQGIDYIYNLNGQLKAINHPSLTPSQDPGHDGTNGVLTDVFGMAIQYHDQDYNRPSTPTPLASINPQTPAQFNGNIQAIQWQNQNGGASTYSYGYNKNNWMKEALYEGQSANNSQDYNVSNITYDANGNIETLKRNGVTDSGGTNNMDEFTYNYNISNNQLTHVTDINDNSDALRFNDLKSQPINNYIYNNIGQLMINNQDKIMYEYNASGLVTKINEIESQNTLNYSTLYFNDYNDFEDYSQLMGMNDPFQNVLWTADNNGMIRRVKAWQEDQDDVFGDSGELIPVDMDITRVSLPEYCTDFDTNDNLYESRLQFNFHENRTHNINPFIISGRINTVKDGFHKLDFDLFLLQQLNSSAGATISIIQEDETIIETFILDSNNYTPSFCNRIIEHITFEFLATGNFITLKIDVDDNANTTNYDTAYLNLFRSAEIDNLHLQLATNTKVAFFYNDRGHRVRKDTYFNFEIYSTFYVRDVSGNPMGIYSVGGRGNPLSLKENPVYGASRIGVFNRNNTRSGGNYVYQLTDHLGNVRAVIMKNGTNALSLTNKTDYYPFGMPMPNRNIEGDYRYKFQGQEKDPETGMEAFELRLWDSRLGRWLSPDPYGEFSSPYIGMGNNPLKYVDVDGGRIYLWHNVGGKLTKFEYRNGSLYYVSSGKEYSGSDSFLNEVKNALSNLDYGYQYKNRRIDSNANSSTVGFINSLVTSKDIYTLRYGEGTNMTQGLDVYLDPKEKVYTYTTKGRMLSPFFITVGHELGHAWDNANGLSDKSTWYKLDTTGDGVENKKVRKSEQLASAIENMFRGEHNLPLRKYYSTNGLGGPVNASLLLDRLLNTMITLNGGKKDNCKCGN